MVMVLTRPRQVVHRRRVAHPRRIHRVHVPVMGGESDDRSKGEQRTLFKAAPTAAAPEGLVVLIQIGGCGCCHGLGQMLTARWWK